MKKKVAQVMVLGCCLLGLAVLSGAAGTNDTAKSNNAFGCDLYRVLMKTPGNFMISPYSLSSALTMTYVGARGTTKEEMKQVLYLDRPQADVPKAYRATLEQISAIEASKKIKLSIANAIWCDERYDVDKSFLAVMENDFKAGIYREDFLTGYKAASQHINRWVSKATNKKIPKLVSPDMVKEAKLVLCNAVYFNGDWKKAFKKDRTKEEPFYVTSSEKVSVPMMTGKEKLHYLDFGHFSSVALPYKGEQLSMVILLPEDKEGLHQVEKILSGEKLEDWMNSLFDIARPQEVTVTMPKFQTTYNAELSGPLSQLGMAGAFGDNADFSGMTGKKELYISSVVHKTFIAVDEKGTEAAAATAVMMKALAVSYHEDVFFRADHPFIYLIRENQSGNILFMGRMSNPKD